MKTTRRLHARIRTLKDVCLYTFWLTKSCLCVTFNTWHRSFTYLPTDVVNATYHTTLTYELFSAYNLWRKTPWLTTCAFIVKRRSYTQLFDLHESLFV